MGTGVWMEAQVDGGPAKALNPVPAESDAAQPDKERERGREKGRGRRGEERQRNWESVPVRSA